MDEVNLNFLLIGKAGAGKRATANTFLNKKVFKPSALRTTEKLEISFNLSQFGRYRLTVVVGIDLENINLNVAQDVETAISNIQKTLVTCNGGIDVFLFVIKFGNTITVEDKLAFDALKVILGTSFMDHVIVVVSCGDLYQDAMEEDGRGMSFDEWCKKQDGEFRQLYDDCNGRFVLFNNREKDLKKNQDQIQQIVQLSHELTRRNGRYGDETFQNAQFECEKLILELRAPEISQEVQQKIDLIIVAIEDLPGEPSGVHIEMITKRIEDLKKEIEERDKGHGVLKSLLEIVKNAEEHLDNRLKTDEVKLNFLLIGKTGHGKSATGNTILNRRKFKSSASTFSETTDVDCSFMQFGKYVLLVVDGPGLADTGMSEAKDKVAAAKNMDKALAMCYGGVDAFLFVFRFGNRFTIEERTALETLKLIFGDSFMDHVIVVVTGGDLYEAAMEEEECGDSFDEWCKKQSSEFQKLYKDCQGRFVLINNREKDDNKKKAQINKIVEIGQDLQICLGRYTSDCFKMAEFEREKMILEEKAPELGRIIQAKICLLAADIEDFPDNPSDIDKEKIKSRIHNLRDNIIVHDKGFGVLTDLQTIVNTMETNLDNSFELKRLVKKLEKKRKARLIWGSLGLVCAVVGTSLAFILPPLGLTIAAVGILVTNTSSVVKGIKKTEIQTKIKTNCNKKKM